MKRRPRSATPTDPSLPYTALCRSDDGRHGPSRDALLDLAHEARDPRRRVLDGADVILKDDLLGGMVEAQVGKPAPMRPGPGSAGRDPPMTQQERLQLLRSDEHTSELQSLMRISYAVYCLNNK